MRIGSDRSWLCASGSRVSLPSLSWRTMLLKPLLVTVLILCTLGPAACGHRVRGLGTGVPSTGAEPKWREANPLNAPSKREASSVVWTGSELIVWGGFADGDYLGSGARYDPEADHWSQTSEQGAPSARAWHTAVWTGTEMIVWGGGPLERRTRDRGELQPADKLVAAPHQRGCTCRARRRRSGPVARCWCGGASTEVTFSVTGFVTTPSPIHGDRCLPTTRRARGPGTRRRGPGPS